MVPARHSLRWKWHPAPSCHDRSTRAEIKYAHTHANAHTHTQTALCKQPYWVETMTNRVLVSWMQERPQRAWEGRGKRRGRRDGGRFGVNRPAWNTMVFFLHPDSSWRFRNNPLAVNFTWKLESESLGDHNMSSLWKTMCEEQSPEEKKSVPRVQSKNRGIQKCN